MPGYVTKEWQQFHHDPPKKRQDSPYLWTVPNYGAKKQYAEGGDKSPPWAKMKNDLCKESQANFCFLGEQWTQQCLPLWVLLQPNKQIRQKRQWKGQALLGLLCVARRCRNNVQSKQHDISRAQQRGIFEWEKAWSRAGMHFYMSNNEPMPPNDGAILNIAQIIKAVMSSAAEAELRALYINAREAV